MARFGWAAIGRDGHLRSWTDVFAKAVSPTHVDDGTLVGGLRARLCTLRGRLEPYLRAVRPVAFLDEVTTKNVIVHNGELRGIIDVDYICFDDYPGYYEACNRLIRYVLNWRCEADWMVCAADDTNPDPRNPEEITAECERHFGMVPVS